MNANNQSADFQAEVFKKVREQTQVGRLVTPDQIKDAVAKIAPADLPEGVDLFTATRMYLTHAVIGTDKFRALLEGDSK